MYPLGPALSPEATLLTERTPPSPPNLHSAAVTVTSRLSQLCFGRTGSQATLLCQHIVYCTHWPRATAALHSTGHIGRIAWSSYSTKDIFHGLGPPFKTNGKFIPIGNVDLATLNKRTVYHIFTISMTVNVGSSSGGAQGGFITVLSQ